WRLAGRGCAVRHRVVARFFVAVARQSGSNGLDGPSRGGFRCTRRRPAARGTGAVGGGEPMSFVEDVGEVPPAEALGRVHFVGIGGAGMSGIARIMLARGRPVSGCDAKDSRALTALRALGADISVGHDPAHVATAETVVTSSAIRPGNRELQAAREAGVRVLPRAA